MNFQIEQGKPTETVFHPAPLWRRLLAIFYDTMVLACVAFIAWQPVPLLPDDLWPEILSRGIRLSYLVVVTFMFFGWFWTHGGQTIGMRAWKIKLVSADSITEPGKLPGWSQAWIRYCLALVSWFVFGLGFIWSLFDTQRRTWHDRGSSTRLVVIR